MVDLLLAKDKMDISLAKLKVVLSVPILRSS
jgi:hypothetical protein